MINWDRIAELQAEIGEDGIQEVVALFVEEVGEAIAALPDLGQAALVEHLHFLKGSAENIGLQDLSTLCAEEGRALRDDPEHSVDIQGIQGTFGRAEQELASLAD